MPRRPPLRHRPAAVAALVAAMLGLSACAVSTPGTGPGAPRATAPSEAAAPSPSPEPPALGAYGVSSGHPLATRAGMEMLERGGNAVDAVIAAAFADAVMQPASSGIGGGGAAIVVVDGVATNYDYRDVVNRSGTIPDGGAGIPGFVAGMERLHADHGSLPWADLLDPAIRIAAEGAPVSRYLAGSIGDRTGQRVTGGLAHFRRPDGAPLVEGDLLVQADLAATMRTIAAGGADAFYRGELVPELAAVPGFDAESLAAYEVQVSRPAEGPVGDYTMLSGAPALPGAALIQMVQISEAAGIADLPPDSAQFVDLQSRSWQVADTSVQRFFGDPAFVDVPVDELTDPARNAEIAAGLPGVAQTTRDSAAADPAEGGNTTHLSIVDAEGRAVSMTNTITNYWGSGQYVGGFFLNDSLERFGDIGMGENNRPEPGRRSVTWSSPTVLLDGERRPVLVIGTPGGRQIPNVTASIVTRWALHRQELAAAVPADRFVLTSGVLTIETPRLAGELAALGWDVRVESGARRIRFGSVQALDVDWEARQVTGVADTRRSAGVETAQVDAGDGATG
ncbi:MAG: gamma-glutamyltransferase [Kineosporiaceae bacterium]